MQVELDTLPEALHVRPAMQAALYIAKRYGVSAVRMSLDAAVGFRAELEYQDAPAWHEESGEFNYLVDGMLQQLIEYVYVHRLKNDS
jgi:hypothetical protein